MMPLWLRVQIIVWLTYGVVHYLAAVPVFPADEARVFMLVNAVRAVSGLVISSIGWLVMGPRLGRSSAGGLAVLGATALVAAILWNVLDRLVLGTVTMIAGVMIPWEHMPHGVDLDYLFVMAAWSAAAAGLRAHDREAALRQALLEQQIIAQQSQLQALTNRLNPHSLFNVLNTIRSLIADEPNRAREMVTRFSAFLRRVLTLDLEGEVALGVEIDLAQHYLEIERARFEERLQVEMNVEAEARRVLVPPLLIQPLIENAIEHGTADARGVRRVRIAASRDRDALVIEVANSGALRNETAESRGLGLSLTRRRLELACGSRARFTLTDGAGSVIATIRIERPEMTNSEAAD